MTILLLILGVAALIAPLAVSRQVIRLEVPIMVACSLGLVALAYDGRLSRLEGALLFGGIVAYTAFAIVQSRRETAAERQAGAGAAETRRRPAALDRVLRRRAGDSDHAGHRGVEPVAAATKVMSSPGRRDRRRRVVLVCGLVFGRWDRR